LWILDRRFDNLKSPINNESAIRDRQSTMFSGVQTVIRDRLRHARDDAV
jgi:hypothetical protein